ncbi:2-hydroxymuconate tautomerase [Oenococcus alcoholitolerans]|uniref:2-hydroxymuconate tautomerase n=1 Tax=Oenococcus alcoholitolerans TaxID=931074 RepID=UPI003F6FFEC3
MPLIQIDLLKGRSRQQIKRLVKDITDAVVEDAGAKREAVNIVIRESDPDHIAAGGVLKSEL